MCIHGWSQSENIYQKIKRIGYRVGRRKERNVGRGGFLEYRELNEK
jgi:hypothetical protein